jgi:hypothetical protein
MTPSRSSATAVAIASGTWTDGSTLNTYAGGSITSIPAASAGKHRYDLIVFDVSTGSVSRIAGSENTPTLSTDFLENIQPLPPELTSESQILIAVIIVTSSGIPSGNFGHYATGGVADMTIWVKGQIDHVNLANKGTNTHAAIDSHIANTSNPHGTTYSLIGAAPAAQGVTNGNNHDHNGGDGAQIAYSSLSGLPLRGADFAFGDGSAVLMAQACCVRIPAASTIKKAYIRSLDTDGALKSGSVTCTIYIHDYNAAIGSEVDSFALASTSSYSETGLSISVAAGKCITCILSGISTVEQIVLSLEMEAA